MTQATTHVEPALLDEYARGDLGPAETRAVERHLAGCDDCRARLTEGLRAAEQDEGSSAAPPSVEVPETAEVMAVPSQVSVMHVPQTIEGDGAPSHTSVTTGIGPRPPRKEPTGRGRGIRRAIKIAVVIAILFSALAAAYVIGFRPRARSGQLTERAGEMLAPVLEHTRLPRLQHPHLQGSTVYRPGTDAVLDAALADAAAALSRAVEADGGNWEARARLGLTQLMRGETRESRAQFQEAEATAGPRPGTQLGLGILDYLAADVAGDEADRAYALDQADGHFQAVALGDPGYAEALYNRAAVSLARGDREQARQLLDAYRVVQPDSTWIPEMEELLDGQSSSMGL